MPPDNPGGGGQGDENSWLTGLTPEQQQHISSHGYKTAADVVNAHIHAERLIGSDKIAVPKDGVWDEASRAKLGIPSDAASYKINRPQLPEGLPYDEKFEQSALAVAHKIGLTNTQAQELIGFWAASQGNSFANVAASNEANQAATVEALQKEWGKAYDDKVAFASRAVKEFGGQELVDYLNEPGVGNNIHLVRAFAKVGELLREDRMPAGRPSGMALTPEQARVEANQLMATEAYRKREHPEHADMMKRVSKLFEFQYPES